MEKPLKKEKPAVTPTPAPTPTLTPKIILDLNNLSENPLPPIHEKVEKKEAEPKTEQKPKEKKPTGLVDQHGNPVSSSKPQEEWSGKKVEKKREKISDEKRADIAKLKTLKGEISELNEKYLVEMQREEKALLYSKLEEKKKEYRALEEKLETTIKETTKPEHEEKPVTPPVTETEKKPTVEEPRPETTPKPVNTAESIAKLNESRDAYLKAKRLRGNIVRGGIGGFFKRVLNFGGEKMNFGGKKGLLELEKVRNEYQDGLSKYRSAELTRFVDSLDVKDEVARDLAIKTKLVELLTEEQSAVDKKSVEGIENNRFEKLKTKFRQKVLTRGAISVGLMGVAASTLTAGTGVAAGAIGARAVMGGAGAYLGIESQIERWSKNLGHRGSLLSKMRNELDKMGTGTLTGQEADKYVASMPNEEIKKEAARLRMLQVEKGVSMDQLQTSGDDGFVASLVIYRDNEITAEEVARSLEKNSTIKFADMLSAKLATEINLRNEFVEKEIDRERLKKMARKTLAGLTGASVGWMIGGELFEKPEMPPVKGMPIVEPEYVPKPPVETEYIVQPGDNTWNIIESKLDTHKIMDGLGEGPRTYMIDALKDKFESMTPETLKGIGFTSGDVDLLKAGDSLVLDKVLGNPKIMADTLFQAKYLNPEFIVQIVNNNKEISEWLVNHGGELKQIYDGKIIEEVLRGIR